MLIGVVRFMGLACIKAVLTFFLSCRPDSGDRHRPSVVRAVSAASQLRQALADRTLIEWVKGILMKKLGLDEDDVSRRMQRRASAKNRKLVEIAETLLTAEEAL